MSVPQGHNAVFRDSQVYPVNFIAHQILVDRSWDPYSKLDWMLSCPNTSSKFTLVTIYIVCTASLFSCQHGLAVFKAHLVSFLDKTQ